MGHYYSGIVKILVFILVAVAVVVTLPRLSPVIFPRLPEPSPTFDCDDIAYYTYQYFESLGIESTPVVGNLDMVGEEYGQCNHVWLLVKSGDKAIAYDWGIPRFDRQHYEGYTIDVDKLFHAVKKDRKSTDIQAGPVFMVGSVGIEPTTNRL
jgi:hypothetical protein